MYRSILLSSACALLVASAARAQEASSLTADDLKAIIAKPHDDTPPLEGLAIFPKVREWKAAGNFISGGGQREPFKGKTTSKRVDGKYEVNQTLFEGHGVSLTMRVPGTRCIAWATIGAGGPEMITVETYEDKRMTWRSVMVNKAGGVTLTTEGEATPAES
jgi:hypothetical protein